MRPSFLAVSSLAGGTALSQLIALVALPVLSRLYEPSQFGKLSLLLAVVALMAPVASLRLEEAVFLPTSLEELRPLVAAASISMVVLSLLVTGFVSILSTNNALPAHGASDAFTIGLSVLLSAFFNLFLHLNMRERNFGVVAQTTFAQAIGTAATQASLALAGPGVPGLIWGYVAGRSLGIISLYRSVGDLWAWPGWMAARTSLYQYRRYPLTLVPAHILNSLGLQFPVFYLTLRFGLEDGGQVGMAERVVTVPLSLIGVAIGQVMRSDLSHQIREKDGDPLATFYRYSSFLMLVGMVTGIFFIFFGEVAFTKVLGQEWELAGKLSQILAVTIGFRMLGNPSGGVLLAFDKTGTLLFLDVVRTALVLSSAVITTLFSSELLFTAAAIYFSLAFTYAVTWLIARTVVKNAPQFDHGAS